MAGVVCLQHGSLARQVVVPQPRDPEAQRTGAQHRRQQAAFGVGERPDTVVGLQQGVVSGGVAEPGLIKPILDGPVLLTGGNFGIEASLTAFVLCTTAGVILLVKAKRRGQIMGPFWQRKS